MQFCSAGSCHSPRDETDVSDDMQIQACSCEGGTQREATSQWLLEECSRKAKAILCEAYTSYFPAVLPKHGLLLAWMKFGQKCKGRYVNYHRLLFVLILAVQNKDC